MTTTFDQLIQRHRMEQEARKAVVVTEDWKATESYLRICWKVLVGRAPVVVQFPGGVA